MNKLEEYILDIIEEYKNADTPNKVGHIINVINNSKEIASYLDEEIDQNVLMACAAFHDIGLLTHGRKNHEIYSAMFVNSDKKLKEFFNEDQIKIIADACREHRSFYIGEFSSVYSEIINDADKITDIETLIRRKYYDVTHKYPQLDELETYMRVYKELQEKYGYTGSIKLNLEASYNILEPIRDILNDDKKFMGRYLLFISNYLCS